MLPHKFFPCLCGGYHFPHRRGGGRCEHSVTRDYHRAVLAGDKEQAQAELAALLQRGLGLHLIPRIQPGQCPF